MKNNFVKALPLFLAGLFVTGVKAGESKRINSLDKNMELDLNVGEVLSYTLTYKGKVIAKESKLGFEIRLSQSNSEATASAVNKSGNTVLTNGFTLKDSKISTLDTKWNTVWGEETEIENRYNEIILTVEHTASKISFDLVFRVFNDGIGFRYSFPKQDNLSYFKIINEKTEFNLAQDMKSFWLQGDYNTNEYNYTESRLSEIPKIQEKVDGIPAQTPVKNAVHTPLMLKRDDGVYINIHEAELIDYSGMCLKLNGNKFTFETELTPDALGIKGYMQTPCKTPWRTIIVSDKATDILASRMILNLNEPTEYKDTKWIKPVKYIGVWWEMFVPNGGNWFYSKEGNVKIGVTDYSKVPVNERHAANNKNVMMYIDFASKHGFDGVLVEGWNEGWEDWFMLDKENVFDFVTPYPDFDVKALNDYAKSKGVALIMHHETSGSVPNYERRMDKAFAFMNKYGYKSVKTGYVGNIIPRGEHHYGQVLVNHYLYSIKKAAEYKIMLNAHEPVHPTGLHRTYPNFMACESGRGMEYEAFSGNNPNHLTVMPFTRFMGGPMDYTPGIFEMEFKTYKPDDTRVIPTTLARQLAYYVTIYSPLQMAADKPQNYEKYMDAFQFIKDVPVDWSKSVYLAAEPGDYIAIARKDRHSENWFVGAITDENQRELEIDFSFLTADKKYEATIYEDKKDANFKTNPKAYQISSKKVDSKSKIKQFLAPGGGVAISIKEVK